MSSAFKVGDRVSVPMGSRKMTGVITEDRGAILARGRHLYEVQIDMDPYEPVPYELPEDEMEPASEADEIDPDPGQVRKYLAHGGLISILMSNLAGGRYQPRAWLRTDSVGGVTHTFEPSRGRIGGQIVPFKAVWDQKVFAPKREEVLSFLRSFHLDQAEAERILSQVGVAP